MSGVLGGTIGSFSPALSLSFVAFANTPSATGDPVVIPASAQVGDIGIYIGGIVTETSTLLALPTGHNALHELSGLGGYRIAWFRVDESMIPGTTSFTVFTTAGVGRITLLMFRPTRGISSVTSSNFTTQNTATTPTNQVLPAITNNSNPIIALAHYRASSTIGTRGSTLTMSETSGSSTQFVKYAIYNTGTTVGTNTISMTDEGSNLLQSLFVTVS